MKNPSGIPWKVTREVEGQGGQDRGGQEAEDSEKKKKMTFGTRPDGSRHPGPGLLRPHLLLGENGAQTKRASVLIGSHQPIGTAQTKRVSVRHGDHQAHGSHISYGNEFIFIEL